MSKLPGHITIGGKTFRVAVFRVESRDEQGRPENCTYVPEDRTIELSKDASQNHFIIGYMGVEGLRPRPEDVKPE